MRALKILVVVMGVLLVLGVGVLVVAVVDRVNHPRAPVAVAAPTHDIELPPGARLISAEASGDRLVLRLALAEGGEQILVLNLATGAPVATVKLHAKPAP